MAQSTADASAVPLEMVMQSTTVRPMDEDEPIAPGKREVTPIPKPEPKTRWRNRKSRRSAAPSPAPTEPEGSCRLALFLPDTPCSGPLAEYLRRGDDVVLACEGHTQWCDQHTETVRVLGLR